MSSPPSPWAQLTCVWRFADDRDSLDLSSLSHDAGNLSLELWRRDICGKSADEDGAALDIIVLEVTAIRVDPRGDVMSLDVVGNDTEGWVATI